MEHCACDRKIDSFVQVIALGKKSELTIYPCGHTWRQDDDRVWRLTDHEAAKRRRSMDRDLNWNC